MKMGLSVLPKEKYQKMFSFKWNPRFQRIHLVSHQNKEKQIKVKTQIFLVYSSVTRVNRWKVREIDRLSS